MQPSFDLRIHTMIKAMKEVVIPAITPGNSAALEQAGLVAASLNLIAEQIDFSHWYEVSDMRLMARMIVNLTDLLPPDATAKARALASNSHSIAAQEGVTLSELREMTIQLRDVACELIEIIGWSGDAGAVRQRDHIVLMLSEQQIERERAFVARTGFDCTPETLKNIRDSLK